MAISNINSLSLDPSGGFPASATATVATSETTTSTSYTDLATAGPAVTVTTGTKALVTVSGIVYNTTASEFAVMAFAVSGATTVAAADLYGVTISPVAATVGDAIGASRVTLLTGLTAGSNVFTAKYKRSNAGTATFTTRSISVIDMGS